MKSSASQPLDLSVFKERREATTATARLIRLSLINYSAVRGCFDPKRGLANAGRGLTFTHSSNVWKKMTEEDLFTAASALQRGTVKEEPTSRLS